MLQRVADWCGLGLDKEMEARLDVFESWLKDEAIVAGGLGRNESARVDDRHIGDSLLFSRPIDKPPTRIWDLGSGVGLPGLPLAIVFPEALVTLVDRSRRRVDLARRAVRILDLPNVEVIEGEIEDLSGEAEVVVSRATVPPKDAFGPLSRLLQPGGVAVWGGSWSSRPVVEGWTTVEVPAEILDHTVWLLMMRSQ